MNHKLFPLVITDNFDAIRSFYVDTLGCALTVETDNYLQVRFGASEDAPELAFMPPTQLPGMPDHGVFSGAGVIVSVPTEDADTHHRRMKKNGAPILSGPSDKPWGWRSYAMRDPAGVILDFFHTIAKPDSVDATG
jgi:lactoylglutathione lyase